MDPELKAKLEAKAHWVRRKVVDMAVRAKSGHVSTAFSQTELLVALYYGGILRYDSQNIKWPERDRFILSKGQGGIGLYPILADLGFFSLQELEIFTQRGSILGVHSEWNIPGIEVITGSLGHGLPMATGIAQTAKNDGKDYLVFCFLGDAELYEGSNWEASFFAAHSELNNLICIVDRNGQGVLGFTDRIEEKKDGPRLDPLEGKFRSFGFEVREINGHSFEEIFESLRDIRERRRSDSRPLMIIAHTKKGKGVSLMEDKKLWHYRVPSSEELEWVYGELDQGRAAEKISAETPSSD